MNIEMPMEIGILKNQLLATNPIGKKTKRWAFFLGQFYELVRYPTNLLYPINAYVFVIEYLYFFQFKRMQ
jgi:hypothetical protein